VLASSTSPDRPELLRVKPLALLPFAIVALPLLWLGWFLATLGGVVGWIGALVMAYLALSILAIPTLLRRNVVDAFNRARQRGGLLHIVEATRTIGHSTCIGWLTLHHDTGDIGFYAWDANEKDVYIPRYTVSIIVREPDDATRITYLFDKIESVVMKCATNDLALWHASPEEAYAAAHRDIPKATARIRDDD
jgi:hypothetical protein